MPEEWFCRVTKARSYTGPRRIRPDLDAVEEIAAAGDFEGVLSFGMGIDERGSVPGPAADRSRSHRDRRGHELRKSPSSGERTSQPEIDQLVLVRSVVGS